MATAETAPMEPSISQRLQIDFLFLDLTTCRRCLGTARSLEAALETVGGELGFVDLVVDAILREVYAGGPVEREMEARTHELPENSAAEGVACCSPAEQDSCCEPEDKAECCGASFGGGCGCR